MTSEMLIQLLQWRLGLYQGDATALARAWAALDETAQWDLTAGVGDELGRMFKHVVTAHARGEAVQPQFEWLDPFLKNLLAWVNQQPTRLLPKLSANLNNVAKSFLRRRLDPNPPVPLSQERIRVNPLPTPAPQTIRPTVPPPPTVPPKPRVTVAAPPTRTVSPPPPPPPPAPPMSPTAAWKFIPPPLDVPDPHAESDAREFPAPDGFKAFGARVRGKKHKHDGTHCDDWFEATTVNGWTVVAVADGAGSKKFSRVGAKVACEHVTKDLAFALADREFDPRETLSEWSHAIRPDEANTFAAPDVEAVAEAVRAAVGSAFSAVRDAATARRDQPGYEAVLNRQLDVNDLSCTLLIAVHKVVTIDGKPCSFVSACQVGDGMIGVVHPNGSWRVLGVADSGGYSGETEFITSAGKTDAAALKSKTQVYLGGLQALLVMTDGVADDYFPPEEQLGRLWADLAVNNIPDLVPPPDDAVTVALTATALPTREAVAGADFETVFEVVMENPRTAVTVRSATEFAERLGVELPALLRSGPLLTAGATLRGNGVPGATASDRLRLWLDAYHVRGSFDDRTLVAVHRETLPT